MSETTNILEAELLDSIEPELTVPPRRTSWWRTSIWWSGRAVAAVWGAVNVVIGLSVLATLPILQLATLGYLLEVVGRTGRTGRWSAGWIGLRAAGRIGTVVVACFLLTLPVRLLVSLHYSSILIQSVDVTAAAADGDGDGETPGRSVLPAVIGLVGMLTLGHILWALYRGGRWRDFLWPAPWRFWRELRKGFDLPARWEELKTFTRSLRLPYYWWLGCKGYVTTLAWIVIPGALLARGTRTDPDEAGGFMLLGIASFAWVASYLPLLQAELGGTGQWQSMFQLGLARQRFIRAPWMWVLAMTLLFAAALPLYLLKAEMVPAELAWFPGLFFIAFMWPARVVMGWAYLWSLRREQPCHWLWRWSARLTLWGVTLIFAGITFFTPQVSWYGAQSIFEQHAFMVPAPFLKLQ